MDTKEKTRGEPPATTWAEDDPVVVPEEFPDELIDELLAGARTGEQITGPDGCSSG